MSYWISVLRPVWRGYSLYWPEQQCTLQLVTITIITQKPVKRPNAWPSVSTLGVLV